ncbi:MAG: phosphopentomutase [Clostridia bacterium]|nr:phosphopentomutase [Clostridia bacterium]
MIKRVFLIVLDSCGVGFAHDAEKFGDAGAYTLGSLMKQEGFSVPTLQKLGLFNISNVATPAFPAIASPAGAFARIEELSNGKDTTIGHWEIAGIYSPDPLPVFPDGFPDEIIDEFSKLTGRGVLCNKPYSGTDVIRDYGEEHMKTGALIVYTSADSVFQIAAHESVVPIDELYDICQQARKLLDGKYRVGRVIARPFEGVWPFKRTSRRHDFSALPPSDTLLDLLKSQGLETYCIGKISDIFAGQGVSKCVRTVSNSDGMDKTMIAQQEDFHGLCFVNLVDFDSAYGHRRDALGYADALMDFDRRIAEFIDKMNTDDVLMITADHGCDPCYNGTDHTRENIPWIVYGDCIKPIDLGTLPTYSDIAATVADMLGIKYTLSGTSRYERIKK